MSPVYPERVRERIAALDSQCVLDRPDAIGTAASMECGTFVTVGISVDAVDGVIADLTVRSNGCGYMLAAAEVMAERLKGSRLPDLQGLKTGDLVSFIGSELVEVPPERQHCLATVVEVIRSVFEEYRRRRVEEFSGEKALICTCFGVSEESIELAIKQNSVDSVEGIRRFTKAGSGCGACQLLIEEMIDQAAREGDDSLNSVDNRL
jgi:NifU-like protein